MTKVQEFIERLTKETAQPQVARGWIEKSFQEKQLEKAKEYLMKRVNRTKTRCLEYVPQCVEIPLWYDNQKWDPRIQDQWKELKQMMQKLEMASDRIRNEVDKLRGSQGFQVHG